MELPRTIAKLFSARVITAALEFAAIAGFTQVLGTGAMGSFFVFQALAGLISIPGDLGISKAAERQLAAGEPVGPVVMTTIGIKSILLLPWVIGLLAGAQYVDQYVGFTGAAVLVAIGLFTLQARRTSIRILAGQLRIDRAATIRIIGKMVWLAGGFALIQSGLGPAAIILGFVFGDLVMTLFAAIRINWEVGLPTLDRARSLIDFGRYVFIGSVGGQVYSWMDVIILRFFVPTPLIGAYEVAWRVASLTMLATRAIRESLFPQVSSWYEQGKTAEISAAFYTWLQPPLYLTIPAFAGAVIVGESVLRTLFGPDAGVAYTVLLIFMIEKILRSIHMVISPSLFAIDKPELGYQGSVAAIVVNLLLNAMLIPFFGIHGAAVATTLGSLTSAAVSTWYIRRFVNITFPWVRIGWSICCAAIMAGSVWVISTTVGTSPPWLFVEIAIGIGVYFLLLLFSSGIRQDVVRVIGEQVT